MTQHPIDSISVGALLSSLRGVGSLSPLTLSVMCDQAERITAEMLALKASPDPKLQAIVNEMTANGTVAELVRYLNSLQDVIAVGTVHVGVVIDKLKDLVDKDR